MPPKFTVVTITYNSSKYVRQAIESVLAQTYSDFEYIISDDCSTDNTWEIIQEYNDPRIRAWRNEKNIGEYPNRNKTLSEAKGEYIYWLDGDDILYKNTIRDYKELIAFFPDAAAIWGVFSVYFDFIVFPYLFSPQEITGLHFLSNYPISLVGFTESLFKTNVLKQIGGLNENYKIGDTFIKRRIGCEYPILLYPAGKAFWRTSPNQASRLVRHNYQSLIEAFQIDEEIISSGFFPLHDELFEKTLLNFKNRRIKVLINNTLLKFKILSFFRIMNVLKIPYYHLFLLFQKVTYDFKVNANGENPLVNRYNFL